MKGDEGGRDGEISEKGIDTSREAEWKDSEDKKKKKWGKVDTMRPCLGR